MHDDLHEFPLPDSALPTPKEPPAPLPEPLPAEGRPEEAYRRWDEFLLALSDGTRKAVWDAGIDSLRTFAQRTREELLAPRGAFTAAQLDEIEGWLRGAGLGFAARTAASADAPLGVRRNHRLGKNRLTM